MLALNGGGGGGGPPNEEGGGGGGGGPPPKTGGGGGGGGGPEPKSGGGGGGGGGGGIPPPINGGGGGGGGIPPPIIGGGGGGGGGGIPTLIELSLLLVKFNDAFDAVANSKFSLFANIASISLATSLGTFFFSSFNASSVHFNLALIVCTLASSSCLSEMAFSNFFASTFDNRPLFSLFRLSIEELVNASKISLN